MTVEQYINKLTADLKRDMRHKSMQQEFKDQARELRIMLFVELSRMRPRRKAELLPTGPQP